MDTTRFIIALALCFLIIYAWGAFFAPKPAPQPQVPVQNAEEGQPEAGKKAGPENREGLAPKERPEADLPEISDRIAVEGSGPAGGKVHQGRLIDVKVTNRSGGIAEVELPPFKSRDMKGTLVLIPEEQQAGAVLGLWVDSSSVPFDRKKGSADLKNWQMEKAQDGGGVTFTKEMGGISIAKEIRAAKDRYHFEVALTFENRSDEERQIHYRLRGPGGIASESLRGAGDDLNLIYGERGGVGEVVNSVLTVSSLKGEWLSPNADRIVLIGSSNNYFAAVLGTADPQTSSQIRNGFAEFYPDPRSADGIALEKFGRPFRELSGAQREEVEGKAYKNVWTCIVSRDKISLKPGAKVVHRFTLFLGPRDREILAGYPELNLTEINYYGWWTILVKIFLWILQGLHFVFRSWGLAIVGLTFLVRAALHPLNRKQQASMMRYQKKVSAVKPQMDAIREKYASNKMKMNQEIQALFKEHGINPGQMMGGCMVIFLQLPVWWALYNSIQYSLDLRQAPFLWIRDLTQPDRLFDLPFTIPFLGWTEVNLLPFIYVVLTIVQQKLQPKPTDPQMQQQMRMMTFMMVFFGFIFYSFPAGFLLYFIASAAISMVESRIIKRILAREGLTPLPAGASSGSGSAAGSMTPRGQALYPSKKSKESREKRK